MDGVGFLFVKPHAGKEDEILEWKGSFEEFLRLEINGTWYRVSDPHPWSYTAKFKKIGLMTDNASTATP